MNAQNKHANEEIEKNRTGEQTGSCEGAKKVSVSRSFSGKYY